MRELRINPKKDLVFNPKVREMCKSCKRYGKNANCPPHIDLVEYYDGLLRQYTYGVFYYEEFVVEGDWAKQGRSSSLKLHKHIIVERLRLFSEGHYFITAFGAGSCKLCTECTFPCPKPDKSLIPIEAAGLDVIATMAKQGIEIRVPVRRHFYRVGIIFYD